MAKDLKLKIKNAQLAEALGSFKKKPKKAPAKKADEAPATEKKKVKARLFDSALQAKGAPLPEEKQEKKDEPVIEATPALQEELPPEVAIHEEATTPQETTPEEPTSTEKQIEAKTQAEPELKPKPPARRPLGPVLDRKPLGPVLTPRASTPPSAPDRPVKDFTPLKDRKFQDVKPRKMQGKGGFDARARRGLADDDEGSRWRKRRSKTKSSASDIPVQRPTELTIRLPISLKDLANEMKLKASQIIGKMMMQGMSITINDSIEDETTAQLIGHEFGCEIKVDTKEEERLQITDKTIEQEVASIDPKELSPRPPVVAFMGHVDHGKTSLIDAIRRSNQAATEAGAITQHIGAFLAHTDHGEVTILDTPGHEAFSSMRERGASATDIVVLVIAGDEGVREQTIEAIEQAKASKGTILVAINKCDKEAFNADNIYRQLAEHELTPEAWGGDIVTVNCSATTGEGVKNLVEMMGLQAEVLELKAATKMRARGVVIESQLHKGLGAVATLLVQNGTLSLGDAVVFDGEWGRMKTMHNEIGKTIKTAGPSTPVKVTGLSSLPEAGSEFIVIKEGEKEARSIAEARAEAIKRAGPKLKKMAAEDLLARKAASEKKNLSLILRADVQGSVEALEQAIGKIRSDKVVVNIIDTGVGEISESDVELAAASGASIIGFHTKIESNADPMIKEKKVRVILENIIYHATDKVKDVMRSLLDKVREETLVGSADVKAIFKSSHLGVIAGCQVADGIIKRSYLARLMRGGEKVWEGGIASIKREKEDVKEVTKGLECGIVLQNFRDIKEGDTIEAYEVTYIEQDL